MRYHKMFHLHGIRYESRKDPSVNRQRLIERITTDSVLDLERFEYKGEPALMVIEPKSGLDIGVVPAEDVEKFLPYLDDPFYVDVIECYDFEDKDECGLKLQFCVLTDKEWEEMQAESERLKEQERIKMEKRMVPVWKRWWFYPLCAVILYAIIYSAVTGGAK